MPGVFAILLSSTAVAETVFVSPEDAHALITAGATVLDARGHSARAPFVARARVVDWRDLTTGGERSGKLPESEGNRRDPRALGVTREHPVVVYGAMASGWGEEGRVWWTLRHLGHPRVRIIDGGIAAWKSASLPVDDTPAAAAVRGPFEPALRPALRAEISQVRKSSGLILDVRKRTEYDGATPHGSARGGHIPGAQNLEWKRLIGADGRVLPADRVRAQVGAATSLPVITYCTGGVRSAFAAAVLTHAGYEVANYDGSWWEWASAR